MSYTTEVMINGNYWFGVKGGRALLLH